MPKDRFQYSYSHLYFVSLFFTVTRPSQLRKFKWQNWFGAVKMYCQHILTFIRSENGFLINISWERLTMLGRLSHLLISFLNSSSTVFKFLLSLQLSDHRYQPTLFFTALMFFLPQALTGYILWFLYPGVDSFLTTDLKSDTSCFLFLGGFSPLQNNYILLCLLLSCLLGSSNLVHSWALFNSELPPPLSILSHAH